MRMRICTKWRRTSMSTISSTKRSKCSSNNMCPWFLCRRRIVSPTKNCLSFRTTEDSHRKIGCIASCIWAISLKNQNKFAISYFNLIRTTCINTTKTRERSKTTGLSSTSSIAPTNLASTSPLVRSSSTSLGPTLKINTFWSISIALLPKSKPNSQR